MIVKQNLFLCCRENLALRKNHITIEPPPTIYAYSDSIYLFICSTVLYCQHIPRADPFSGCNVSCCRLFRRRVRFARPLSCTQPCRWSWWAHFIFQAFHYYRFYMSLSHIIVISSLLRLFDVISVWLLLCYKSFEYCVCQHYRSRDDTEAQRLDRLRSCRYKMVSEHTLNVGHDH